MCRLWIVCLLAVSLASAQRGKPVVNVEPLWPTSMGDADAPTLSTYTPKGGHVDTGVVICPGGGYAMLASDHEGDQVAQWFNSLGVTAFVLKYRLGPKYHHPVELGDVQRAIRLARWKAAALKISAEKIGVMGFSAGGHLASSVSTHFDAGKADAADAVDRWSSRPDFAVLVYPVITFTAEEYVHMGSRKNLLGESPDPGLVKLMSSELQVTPETPPTFLVHTTEDKAVPVENSVLYYLALRRAKVPAEMHIYEKGPHGFGLGWADATLSTWPGRLADWLRGRGLL